MRDVRYLIRLANTQRLLPESRASLMESLKRVAVGHGGDLMNLRVTAVALEFDLFLPAGRSPDAHLAAWSSVGPCLTCHVLQERKGPADPEAIVAETRLLFGEQRYWEAHEALEQLWRERQGDEKGWVQALIIAAAALVHHQRHEPEVGWRMLADALRRFENAPESYYGWDWKLLRKTLEDALNYRRVDKIAK
jgi:uncharacterized protein